MSYLAKFLQYYDMVRQGPVPVELELKILFEQEKPFVKALHDPHKFVQRLIYAASTAPTVRQTINFICTDAQHGSTVKELVFVNGVQDKSRKRIYKKTHLHPPMYICHPQKVDMKMTICAEEELPDSNWQAFNEFDLVRFKHRFSFSVGAWRMDITYTDSTTSSDVNALAAIRDKMFKCATPAGAIEVEFEHVAPYAATMADFADIYAALAADEGMSPNNLEIYLAAALGTKNAGLKKMLPPVVELSKRQYYEEIAPNMHCFYATDKADGIRTILVLDAPGSFWYNALGSGPLFDWASGRTILESEKVGDQFYVFDALECAGESVIRKPFTDRLAILSVIAARFPADIHLKEFLPMSPEALVSIVDAPRDYEIDGVIMTSADKPYRATRHYKWKPLDRMSIDFVAKRCPRKLLGISPYTPRPGCVLYLLFLGITRDFFDKLGMERLRYYNTIFSQVNGTYFPMHFSPSDQPYAYLFWYDGEDDLDNKIVELGRCSHDRAGWTYKGIRHDRTRDLEHGAFYGNNYKVAEIIWCNFANPLTLEFMCSPRGDEFYFVKNSGTTMEAVRKFNNCVKAALLGNHVANPGAAWVVDLGAGRGNDIFKYAGRGVRNVLLIDSNKNNLCEAIDRKYAYAASSVPGKLSIYTQQADLSGPWKDTIEQLRGSGIPLSKPRTELIVCHFAVHYFAANADAITNLAELISNLLPKGGKFVMTCINGKELHRALTVPENPFRSGYQFRLCGSYNKFTGIDQYVDVLLPFADGQFYRECLVSIDLITRMFRRKKMALVESVPITTYLADFDGRDLLTADDLQYLALLNAVVYERR